MWKPYTGGGGGPNAAGSGKGNGAAAAPGEGAVGCLGLAGLAVGPVLGDGRVVGLAGLGSSGLLLLLVVAEVSQRDLRLEAEEEEDGLCGGPLGWLPPAILGLGISNN